MKRHKHIIVWLSCPRTEGDEDQLNNHLNSGWTIVNVNTVVNDDVTQVVYVLALEGE